MITKLTSKAKFMARVKELGCSVTDDEDTLKLDAPEGHVFGTTFTHYIDIWHRRGWKMGEVYTSMMEDMSMGVVPCEDADCEWCNGE